MLFDDIDFCEHSHRNRGYVVAIAIRRFTFRPRTTRCVLSTSSSSVVWHGEWRSRRPLGER
jgi:hypothetical protein